jgi:hypothetical protein
MHMWMWMDGCLCAWRGHVVNGHVAATSTWLAGWLATTYPASFSSFGACGESYLASCMPQLANHVMRQCLAVAQPQPCMCAYPHCDAR